MRFLRLDVLAFGKLEGVSLALEGGKEGLFVVYGKNEAGKSTTLRAIDAALFGFPIRTEDNFRFQNSELRVGLHVRFDDGSDFAFIRKKASKGTALDQLGNAIDEAPLRRRLVGIDSGTFAAELGIDQERLRAGGRALLEGKGDAAESLFGAGLGRSGVKETLLALEERADTLFRPRGTSVLLKHLKTFGEAREKRKGAEQSAGEYTKRVEELEAATRAREHVLADQRNRTSRVAALDRLTKIRPDLAVRRRLIARLEPLRTAVLLAADFSERHRDATQNLREARRDREHAHKEVDACEETLRNLPLASELVAEEETIRALNLASYEEHVRRAPLLEGKGEVHRKTAAQLLREIRFEADTSAESLPTERDVNRASQAATHLAQAERDLQRVRRDVVTAQSRCGIAEQALADLPSGATDERSGLGGAIDEAMSAGSIDQDLLNAKAELERAETATSKARRALRLADSPNDGFVVDHLPSEADVELFVGRRREIDESRNVLKVAREALEKTVEKARRTLARLAKQKRVPSEGDLDTARAERDEVWDLVKASWRDGVDVSGRREALHMEGDLAAVYEDRVRTTDDLSDRLRSEADAVAARASSEEQLHDDEAAIGRLTERNGAIDAESVALEAAWQKLWARSGVTPGEPSQMVSWLRVAEAFSSARDAEARAKRRVADVQGRAAHLLERLGAALGCDPEGHSVAALQKEAIERKREVDERARDAKSAKEALAKALYVAAAAERELLTATERSAEALAPLRLTTKANEDDVSHVADRLSRVRTQLESAQRCDDELVSTRADITAFEVSTASIVERTGEGEHAPSPAEAARLLGKALTMAMHNARERERLESDRERHRLAEAAAQEGERLALEVLHDLCAEARVSDVGELPEAERRSIVRREVEGSLDAVETTLARSGAGSPDDIEREASQTTEDQDRLEIAREQEEIENLDARQEKLSEQVVRLRIESEAINGADVAAREAQSAESALADLEAIIPEYLQNRFAEIVLRRRIEKFREENEAPIVKRASSLFSQLTLGAFTGVRVEDDDRPRLVGTRGKSAVPPLVEVDRMSEGTRDQLFLALRLAALEQRLAGAERLPFIVDDILVNFDDDRAQATLEALAELSRTTQVLLFTHHEKVVDLASQLPSDQVFVRHL